MVSKQESRADVKVRTLPMQVAGHLVRQIIGSELDPDRAPSELDITRDFGVSRVVARETLKILASVDIVRIAQGRRVSLRPPEEWDYLSVQLLEWLPAEEVAQLLRELQEMRLMLEPELAAKAAESADEAALQSMSELLRRMRETEESPEEYLELDMAFHLEICKASRNRILDRIMYSARWLLATSRRATNDQPHSLHNATPVHQGIYDAIAAGDSAGAREAMRAHLQANITILTKATSRRGSSTHPKPAKKAR
ncbi:FadR/GntR family transcriptional regulator [Microlunatus soli]|uniref:DNA-binding transcriptional regulator, FadR family n=1 Tax=Microlunatus soli TaxID=630515 RepID=A0A1H1VRD7_9ACTN|nr:FadR/GntR family transcriptional regulator [Microlunatus soli]SDS86806.1 DNA-binding transcriptional regulator, FadR family [Microlunatus soli]